MNDITNQIISLYSQKCTVYACLSRVHYIPDEVQLMRWAPSLGAAGLAALPRPEDEDYNSMVESKIMESDLKCVPVLVAFEAAEAKDGAEEEEARGA